MPGVPSGRGCDACRKQKKKCDQARPACSRCQRLNLACIGSGQQRYKFKTHAERTSRSDDEKSRRSSSSDGADAWELIQFPSNETSLLLSSLCRTIDPSTDFRYNISWTYGAVFEHVPKRIGVNQALDDAIKALVSGHSDVCMHRSQASPHTLSKHCRALSTLRLYLNDKTKAYKAETLCAVYLLLICQAFVGLGDGHLSVHGEGAAQILKARGYFYKPQDMLEQKLLHSLRASLVVEGLINNNIRFTSEEWKSLVENDLDNTTTVGEMMKCLGQMPELLQRGRIMRSTGIIDLNLWEAVQSQYQSMKGILKQLLGQYVEAQGLPVNKTTSMIHTYHQRIYGLGLFVAATLNCMASSYDRADEELVSDAKVFCNEILILAEQSHIHRPLGASYIQLCLMAAYSCNTDPTIEPSIIEMIEDYLSDFPHMKVPATLQMLDEIRQNLQFGNISTL